MEKFTFRPFEFEDEYEQLYYIFKSWDARVGIVSFKGSKAQKKNALKRFSKLTSLRNSYLEEREAALQTYISMWEERAKNLRESAASIRAERFWWEVYPTEFPKALEAEAQEIERRLKCYQTSEQ